MKISKMLLLIVLIASLGCFVLSCDEEENGGNQNTGSCFGDGNAEDTSFVGYVQDLSSKQGISGLTVIALDNVSGEPIEGQEATSGTNGKVTFEGLPAGRVGFKVLGVEDNSVSGWSKLDTYQFNIRSNADDEVLWSVAYTTYKLVLTSTGITLDDSKAIAAGGAYWLDSGNECAEYPIGCGIAETESGEGDIRYSKDSPLPTALENQSNLSPTTGRWVAANVTPGPVTVKVKVGGEVVGQTTFRTYAGMAISIGNVEADEKYTTNPGTCK